jgi:hypothetical protein
MISRLMLKNSEKHSEQNQVYSISKKLKIQCVLYGLSFGFCGLLWILNSHSRPMPAIYYHVPLAVAFGAWLAVVNANFREHGDYSFIVVTLFSLIIVAGRIFLKWPVSGHGILGTLIAVLGSWFWLRLFATAIILQAYITKWIMDTEPLSVLYGALVGLALAGIVYLIRKKFFTKTE